MRIYIYIYRLMLVGIVTNIYIIIIFNFPDLLIDKFFLPNFYLTFEVKEAFSEKVIENMILKMFILFYFFSFSI